ncbi:T9SS type A sorting domain-containing protein [Polaribacter porphyrae]|uniref:Secretion system C-terminal sorting domain-containing protein n=1 Tax=Polaribacter porphyrae TaxID=1137780 RepID=A0A2S7WQT6_9FLAO|nr:T9SS type A sorting domain-containing protein [Polaribacter porphyrae]PQJ79806.1 hypothetical protein BTO18_11750 [Polaribacter porphyrae]
MLKKITLKMTFAFLLTSAFCHSQTTISATSSGFTRENSTVDGASNGSYTFQNLPMKRPSFAGTGTDGRKNYFNFDYNSISDKSIVNASFRITFSSISNAGNDGGFTLVLKAYVEDINSLPLDPNADPYNFIGYTEYSIEEKVYNGGGDYPTAGTVVNFDIEQFLKDRLSESKTKVLFEISIKAKVTDNTFFGNIASSLKSTTSQRPVIVATVGNGFISASGNWSTASNWSTGSVPTSAEDVVINSGNVATLDVSSATVDDLFVEGTFNVSAGNQLTVDGNLTQSGTLSLQSDASSSSAMIVNGTSTGNVTYNRHLTAVAGDANGWHLLASPVAGQTFNNAYATANDLATSTTNATLRGLGVSYNDGAASGSKWSYLSTTDSNAGTFSSGNGYSMKKSSTGTVAFTGTINTDNVNGIAVSTAGNGFNLLGNPYTSFMSSQTFFTNNSDTTGEIWTYASGSGYTARAAVQNFVVAPGQGFFIDVTSGTAVNFSESNQALTGDLFQKTNSAEVKLTISDGTNSRYAQILYFDNNVSVDHDKGYEARLFSGVSHSFAVYSHLLGEDIGEKYQVQSLPNSNHETMVIPIGIIADSGKEITFKLEALNLPKNLKVYLEDRENNIFTRLDEANMDYKITLNNALNSTGRFYLHSKSSSVLNTENLTLSNVGIYPINENMLRITGINNSSRVSVNLYSILGKKVFDTSFTSNGVSEVSLPDLNAGIYIVQLSTDQGKINKKIVLE